MFKPRLGSLVFGIKKLIKEINLRVKVRLGLG